MSNLSEVWVADHICARQTDDVTVYRAVLGEQKKELYICATYIRRCMYGEMLHRTGWIGIGWDWISAGGVRYRPPYGSKKGSFISYQPPSLTQRYCQFHSWLVTGSSDPWDGKVCYPGRPKGVSLLVHIARVVQARGSIRKMGWTGERLFHIKA